MKNGTLQKQLETQLKTHEEAMLRSPNEWDRGKAEEIRYFLAEIEKLLLKLRTGA